MAGPRVVVGTWSRLSMIPIRGQDVALVMGILNGTMKSATLPDAGLQKLLTNQPLQSPAIEELVKAGILEPIEGRDCGISDGLFRAMLGVGAKDFMMVKRWVFPLP